MGICPRCRLDDNSGIRTKIILVLFSRVVFLYCFYLSKCSSSKNLNLINFRSRKFHNVSVLFIRLLMYVMCSSERNVRSSLYECNVLILSTEEVHFVSLIHFKLELCCDLCARG